MFGRYFRRNQRIDPNELDRQTREVNEKLEKEAGRRESIADYLVRRKDHNGFGTEFDITLRPKGSV